MFTSPANENKPEIQGLTPAMRRLCLELLSLGYPAHAAQADLANASDGKIAWQVQSMLDDFADFDAVPVHSNDNEVVTFAPAANDNQAEAA